MTIERYGITINIVLLIASVAAGPIIASEMSWPVEDEILSKVLILIAVSAASVLAVSTFSYVFSDARSAWYRPTLRRHPFTPGQPLQSAFIGGLSLLAMSTGCLVSLLWGGPPSGWLLFLSLGVGFLGAAYIGGLAFVSGEGQ
jgi:hypothetical protein